MLKNILIFFLFFYSYNLSYAIDKYEVLKKVDQKNRGFKTILLDIKMDIKNPKISVTKSLTSFYDRSQDISYAEYTNKSDKGTRYLMVKDIIWVYLPDIENSIRISGDLLKDSIMGGDVSYDDMLSYDKLSDIYDINGDMLNMVYEGKNVYVLYLVVKEQKATVPYPMQELWIDKKTFNVYKKIAHAKGRKGYRAIKEFLFSDYKKIGTIDIPTFLSVKDLRKKNSKTLIEYSNIKIDIPLDDRIKKINELVTGG